MPIQKKMIYTHADFVTMALEFNFTSRLDYFLRASFCDAKFPYHPEMYYPGFNWNKILKTKEGKQNVQRIDKSVTGDFV